MQTPIIIFAGLIDCITEICISNLRVIFGNKSESCAKRLSSFEYFTWNQVNNQLNWKPNSKFIWNLQIIETRKQRRSTMYKSVINDVSYFLHSEGYLILFLFFKLSVNMWPLLRVYAQNFLFMEMNDFTRFFNFHGQIFERGLAKQLFCNI